VAALLADALGRDAAWQAREVAAYTAFALGHLPREVQSVRGAYRAGGI
jgi:glycerol-3-phosphate dehydrogenase